MKCMLKYIHFNVTEIFFSKKDFKGRNSIYFNMVEYTVNCEKSSQPDACHHYHLLKTVVTNN